MISIKEILAGNLDQAIIDLGLNATKTYQLKNRNYEYMEEYQVWEVSDESYNLICNMSEEDWKDDWGWWRSADGSNMCAPYKRYNINRRYVTAWDNGNNENKYNCLTEYLSEEIGVSQPRNVCALCVDLAHINNMKMSELFCKYQG